MLSLENLLDFQMSESLNYHNASSLLFFKTDICHFSEMLDFSFCNCHAVSKDLLLVLDYQNQTPEPSR